MIKTATCTICHRELTSNGKTAITMELQYHLINEHRTEWFKFVDAKNKYLHTISDEKEKLKKQALRLTENTDLIMPNYSGTL